jgi:hypothetical protein
MKGRDKMNTLPLSDIVNISVNVGPVSSIRSGFNLGLIIGKSTIIDAATRVKTYSKLLDMTADGWQGTEPEYLAAQMYFSQVPRPLKVAIGRWDGTATETAVEAVTACRTANSEWYGCTVCGALKADIIAVATYIESAIPASAYFYTTADADVLAGTAGNVMDTLKQNKIHRSIGQYSTTTDAIVAIMGYAMGANTQTADSAYTLADKQEVGVSPESLTSTQVNLIKNTNGNYYVNYGATYNLFENGVMADGTYFDELLNLDILTNNIQTAIINAFTTLPKVPQTDDGVSTMTNAITTPLEKARSIGFVSPGIWNTAGVLSVKTGDVLTRGYVILNDTIANQSQADRDARKSPPIYILVKLSGAMQNVVIGVYVNR